MTGEIDGRPSIQLTRPVRHQPSRQQPTRASPLQRHVVRNCCLSLFASGLAGLLPATDAPWHSSTAATSSPQSSARLRRSQPSPTTSLRRPVLQPLTRQTSLRRSRPARRSNPLMTTRRPFPRPRAQPTPMTTTAAAGLNTLSLLSATATPRTLRVASSVRCALQTMTCGR